MYFVNTGPTVKGGAALMSSSESLEPGSSHSMASGFQPTVHRQPWKGSTQSLRSHGSRQHCKFSFYLKSVLYFEFCEVHVLL